MALSDPLEHSRDNVIAARLAEHERLRRGGAGSLEQILLDCVTRSRQPGLDHVFRDVEDVGRFCGAEALHLPQHEHFAIAGAEGVDRGLDPVRGGLDLRTLNCGTKRATSMERPAPIAPSADARRQHSASCR